MDADYSAVADDVDVRVVQPFQATKPYLCPGCNQDIPPRTLHIVAVPRLEPDLRRHWHRACWENRTRRQPGRAPSARRRTSRRS